MKGVYVTLPNWSTEADSGPSCPWVHAASHQDETIYLAQIVFEAIRRSGVSALRQADW